MRWADLGTTIGREQAGHRPVLVISQDVFNARSGTVIVLALTSREPRAGFPLTFEIKNQSLPKRSWVKISQVRTLDVDRLGEKICIASDEEIRRILEGLNLIVGG